MSIPLFCDFLYPETNGPKCFQIIKDTNIPCPACGKKFEAPPGSVERVISSKNKA